MLLFILHLCTDLYKLNILIINYKVLRIYHVVRHIFGDLRIKIVKTKC